MRKLLFIAGTLVLIIAGCASGPTITVNSAPGVDLSSFQTFNFMQPLGTDRSNGTRTSMSAMLMQSVSSELTSRGLRQSDSPDLLVDFFVTTEDRVDVRTSSSGMHSMHRSHWNRGCCSTWPTHQTTVRQYTEGTLLIDFIDPGKNAMVAEGAAQSRVSSNVVTQQQSNDVVGQIMTSLMPR